MTKSQKNIYNWLSQNKGYLKCSPGTVLERYWEHLEGEETVYSKDVDKALKRARIDFKEKYVRSEPRDYIVSSDKVDYQRLSTKVEFLRPVLDRRNTLIIGDKHLPFEHEGYLDFMFKWKMFITNDDSHHIVAAGLRALAADLDDFA